MNDSESHRPADDEPAPAGDLDRGGDPPRDRFSSSPPSSPPSTGRRPLPRAQSPPVLATAPAAGRDTQVFDPRDRDALRYETFYGLREKPFSAAADSRFLYHSASHDRAAQELFDSILRRDGFAVLTGNSGTGKTMLCRALLDRVDRRTFTSFIAEPFVALEDLLKAILLDFGVISHHDIGGRRLAAATRQELIVALHEFLLSLPQINGFAVVFIDDAQTLSSDMLAQVHGIADPDRALMGVVLVGLPELLGRHRSFESTAGGDRLTVRVQLGPLAQDEVRGYVVHRLAVSSAGPARIEFDAAALSLVYEISRGVPQRINLLCDRALTRGFEDSVTLIDAPLIASAARDLDLLAPVPATRRATTNNVWVAVALLVGLLLGMAGGAFAFRAQLRRAIADWTAPATRP